MIVQDCFLHNAEVLRFQIGLIGQLNNAPLVHYI